MGGAEIAGAVGGEGAAVVGLEDQRRPVSSEELAAVEHDGVGGLGGAGRGQEDEAAGEVADEQDVVEDPIDGHGCFGKVGGPDGAGREPGEVGGFDVMFFIPAFAEIVEGGAGEVGETPFE